MSESKEPLAPGMVPCVECGYPVRKWTFARCWDCRTSTEVYRRHRANVRRRIATGRHDGCSPVRPKGGAS